MTQTNLYIDLNVLQTLPPSNVNRDDTGAPKTALYGGVTRSRVSSQSWKRAVRQAFAQDAVNIGTRTKQAAQLLADKLTTLDSSLDQDAVTAKVDAAFKAASIRLKDRETGALLFVSPGQIDKLAQYLLDHDDFDKKEIKKVLKGDQSLDLALFGRMVADNPELNVDGAAQVAHAISTHEIVPEYDYYTALDDLQGDDTTGAAMLGTIDFGSATLYRYANVNVTELRHNLGETDAVQGAVTFIKDFLLSMPTGKQNTFANKTLPSYVMVTLRSDTPVNLVSAFEQPVSSRQGYLPESIQRLEAEYQSTLAFVDQPLLSVVLSREASKAENQVDNLTALLQQVTDGLAKAVQHENIND